MAKDIYVAIWHLDTRADPGGVDESVGTKMRALTNKLASAKTICDRLGMDDGDTMLFAAPEYYFAMGGDYIRGYSADEKDQIKNGLRGLSATYPKTVLIAGTTAWKEELDRSQRRKVTDSINQKLQAVPHLDRGGYKNEVEAARANIAAPKNIFKRTSSKKWFGHNTAYIYSDGLMVGELNKSTNAGEFSGEDDGVVMIPGFRSGKFDMPFHTGADGTNKLTVGVEICGDHGRLHNTFGERVDIHVLISASQRPGSPGARDGGIFVHADNQERPNVFRSEPMGVFFDRKPGNWGADNIVDDGADLYVCKAQIS